MEGEGDVNEKLAKYFLSQVTKFSISDVVIYIGSLYDENGILYSWPFLKLDL